MFNSFSLGLGHGVPCPYKIRVQETVGAWPCRAQTKRGFIPILFYTVHYQSWKRLGLRASTIDRLSIMVIMAGSSGEAWFASPNS